VQINGPRQQVSVVVQIAKKGLGPQLKQAPLKQQPQLVAAAGFGAVIQLLETRGEVGGVVGNFGGPTLFIHSSVLASTAIRGNAMTNSQYILL
jgi:hypothetical protein